MEIEVRETVFGDVAGRGFIGEAVECKGDF